MPFPPVELLGALTLTASLGVLAPLLTVARGVPQAVRIVRRDADGVSVATWLLFVSVAQLWVAYGVIFHVPAEVAANVPNALVAAVVVFFAARERSCATRSALVALALTAGVAALATIAVVADAHWLVALPAVCGSLFLFVPQLVTVMAGTDLDGVSPTTWTLALVTALAWGLYGALIRQPAVWIPSAVMIPSSLLIVIRLRRPVGGVAP